MVTAAGTPPAGRGAALTGGSVLRGTPVVPGVAHGPALLVRNEVCPVQVAAFDGAALDPEAALAAYDRASAAVADGFAARASRVSGAAAEVLTASAGLARDTGLRRAVRKELDAGADLLGAVAAAVEQFASILAGMGGLMAERVTDLRDIERRVVARAVGAPEPGVPVPDTACVLVAEELAPADAAGLDPALVLALVTERGGPTGHTAVLARQLGIPCIVGVSGAASLEAGTRLLVDGSTGEVRVAPDREQAEHLLAADGEARAASARWEGPGRTHDGHGVAVMANVADAPSATAAAAAPVEGVGLFRTELCFLHRADEPSVVEQADVYAAVLAPFAGRTVVVRTLDAGSDKSVAFAAPEGEENPALGLRGLRLAIDDPGLLDRQLDAVALAAERTGTETWVMAPMVATVGEAADFAGRVRARGLRPGVMIEVPSVALLAHRVLEVVDFLSVGTNDLTQYAMAADRTASGLAHLTDPWQPAVLHLVAITAEAGRRAGKPVGVCGEAAADPLLARVLVGMGITSLSMAAAAVRPVGAALGGVDLAACEDAAEAALAATDPAGARDAARERLEGHVD